MGWSEVKQGTARRLDSSPGPGPAQPRQSALPAHRRPMAGAGYGVANDGFAGMGVRKGEEYVFSAFVRGGPARLSCASSW